MQLEAPVILAVPTKEGVSYRFARFVRFDADSRPFGLFATYCSLPQCDCGEATLKFFPVTASGRPKSGEGFLVRIDLRTGQRIGDGGVGAFESHAAEAVRDFPREILDTWREEQDRESSLVLEVGMTGPACLATMPHLPSIADLLGPGASRWSEHPFELDGVPWIVTDRYCPDANCTCTNVHLDFRRADGAPGAFLLRMEFEGEITDWSLEGVSMGEAEAVAQAWARSWTGTDGFFVHRDAMVKSLGYTEERSLSTPIVRDAPKVGRNDACPCGSGKKYKKCCGR